MVTDLLDQTGPVDVDSAGRSVVLGVKSDAIAIARYLPDGTPDTSFSGDGRADVAVPVATARLADVRVLADGSIVAMGYRTTDPMNPFSNGLWSAKVTSSGAPSGGYGTNGVSIYDQGFTVFGPLGSIASDGSATIVQGGIGGGFGTMISPTGTFGDVVLDYDLSALPPGCGFQAPPSPRAAVRVSTSEFIHAIQLAAPIPACGLDIDDTVVAVTRQDDSGTIVWTKVLDAGEAISDEIFQNPIALVGSDVVLATEDGATNYVHRLSATTGAPVSSWGTAGRATIAAGFGDIGGIAELAGGKVGIVNAATFTSPSTSVMVERLTSTGAPDASFGRVTVPVGGELTSTAIAGAPTAASTSRPNATAKGHSDASSTTAAWDPVRMW